MKYIRYILTVIALLSLAGCFGFSVAASSTEREWDGYSTLKDNRVYVFDSAAYLNDTVTVPANTMLIFNDEASLTVGENGLLEIYGDVYLSGSSSIDLTGSIYIGDTGTLSVYGDVEEDGVYTEAERTALTVEESGSLEIYGDVDLSGGSSIDLNGSIYIGGTGTMSVYGSVNAEEGAYIEAAGVLDIQQDGKAELKAESLFDESCTVLNKGRILLVRGSSTTLKGQMYIEDGGEIIAEGTLTVDTGGLLDSAGNVTAARQGSIYVMGTMNLREGSVLTDWGTLETADGAEITDLSVHADVSIYTASLLEQYDETILRGIDISWVQGDIDWEAVSKSGIQFAIIRAGRGDFEDSGCKMDDYFIQNITGASENGIDVGVYFYSYAKTVEEALEEAEFLVDIIKGYEITFPIIMDIEEEAEEGTSTTEVARAFLERLEENGYFPMLYSYRSWLDSNIDEELLEKYAVWVAQTGENQPETTYNYYIWQYTHDGEVNGIEGNVDYNVAYRDFPEIFKENGLNGL